MRVPLTWLQEFVPLPGGGEETAALLTAQGLEVEEVLSLGEGLRGVKVAEVAEVAPLGRTLQRVVLRLPGAEAVVVTGAPNVAAGQRVVWAPPGAVLPDGRVLGVATFLGVASEGMLLSAEEMGIGPESDGILVLDPEAEPGGDATAVLRLPETVLDLSLTPSFASFAQSVVGVARELAAGQGMQLALPSVDLPPAGEAVVLEVPEPELCPQYYALRVDVPGDAPSPLWLKRRLWAAGMRSHGLAVDVTNYLMLEWGHPVHAFDFDRLTAPLAVRRAAPGERITLLDGVEYQLATEDLVIADAHGPIALAGVMGGLASGVSPTTRRVLFEVALFDPLAVRRTALRHRIASEARARFEKGVDPADAPRVLARLGALLSGAGATIQGLACRHDVAVKDGPTILLRAGTVERLLGLRLSSEEVRDVLTRLGMEVTSVPEGFSVSVPSYRHDLRLEADLVEEVARLVGYDRLEAHLPPATSAGIKGARGEAERAVRAGLVALGAAETLSYSWVPAEEAEVFSSGRTLVRLENPLREGEDTLRPSLLPRLLRALRHNLAHQVQDVRLFEIGTVFWREGEEVREEPRAALAGIGALFQAGPTTPDVPVSPLVLKGLLNALAARLGRGDLVVEPATGIPFLHPGRQAALRVRGEMIGWLGELHPSVAQRFDLPRGVTAAEWQLMALAPSAERTMRPLPRFPGVRRDLSLVLDEAIPYGTVERAVRAAGVESLRRLRIFDLYTGAPLAPGEKSIAISLWFQSDAGTLTESEVDASVARILVEVERVGGRLRQ
jgi:phenylalanyl-tRNA synthetase beta chain